MDDETLQSVINRVDRLDNRLQQVEHQSRDWIAQIGRVGIIVACVSGMLGGIHTSWVLWKGATIKPNIKLIPAAKLDMYWTPEGRRLSFAWVESWATKGKLQALWKSRALTWSPYLRALPKALSNP